MNKFFGSKIAIKFTQPLIGDVEGNESAFTVTGKEPQYVKFPSQNLGPLIDGDYQVDKVERMPVRELWTDDFSGAMTDVEALAQGIALEGQSDESDVLIDIGTSAASTANWIPYKSYYYKNKVQYLVLAAELSDCGINPGTLIKAISFKVSSAPTRNLSNFRIRIKETEDTSLSKWHTTGFSLAHYSQSIAYTSLSAGMVYKHLFNADITEYEYQGGNLLIEVSRDDTSGTNSGGMYLRSGLGSGSGRMITAYKDSGYSFPFDYIPIASTEQAVLESTLTIMTKEYVESGSYVVATDTEGLPDKVRLCIEADTPTDTSINIEYACTEDDVTEPAVWTAAEDQDLLTIDNDYLWLRYTLATEDVTVTPTISEVWLEEPSAPVGTLLLTMKALKRFRNVEGDLTVKYDHTKGTLAGAGGPVQTFEDVFSPTGLARVPNPYIEEKIEVNLVNYELDLKVIQHIVVGDGPYPTADTRYQKATYDWDSEKIGVSLSAYALVLTHINDLNV